MAQEPSSTSSQEVAETSPAASTGSGLASSPSRRPVAAAAAAAAAAANAQSPSSESTARTDYTLPATKPAPRPKRTYGKAPTTAAPASIPPAAPPCPTLKETTSVVIPETDPNAPPPSEPAFVHSPEDRVKNPVLAAASSSSQTPASQHTTDPTSEEEVGSKSKRPARRLLDASEDAESDSSSDDAEADGDDGGMAAFLKNKIRLEDLDAAVDKLEPAAVPSAAEKPPPAESSSLPPLTPSTKDASEAVDPSSEATPLRASHDQQPTQDAPSSVDVGPTRPQAAPSPPPRRRRRAIESDESDQEVVHDKKAALTHGNVQLPTPAATAPPHKSTKERLKLLAEKQRRRQEQSENRRGKSAMAEEPEAAGADLDDGLEEEPEDVVDEVDAIMNEASTGKKSRNGLISRKRKSKGLTKKEQEEMEKTAAAHARKVDVHLAATSRPALSVTDVFKKRPLAARPSSPVRYVGRASTPQTARPVIDLLATSSSDSIENPDNDPAPTTPAYALKNAAASSKRSPRSDDIDDTPMPLRTLPTSFRPIGKTAKPGPAKKTAEPIAAVADDEDEGLEEFDLGAELVRSREQAERARKEQEKEEKRRALAERKQAAIRASRSKAPPARATEDSDSDLDIEGAPDAKKSVRHSRRSRSPSAAADTLAQYASRRPSSPKRTAALNELLRFARASSEHPLSDDVEPSESQFKAAGKTFGANLDPNKRYLTGAKNRRQQAPVTVTQDINNEHLQRKMREQNAKERAKKQRNYRQMEQTRENEPKELESVNVDAMVKAKKEREEEDEKMEEDGDGDYVDEEDDGGEEYNSADIGSDGDDEDDVGSGSDVPVANGRQPTPAPQNVDDDELFDSEGEPVLPKSSQNDDRLGKAPDARDAFSDAEDEDEDSMLPPALSRKARKAARIVDDEEEAQEEADVAAVPATIGGSLEGITPKKTRVELGGLLGDVGGDDGGFSQFFNSQFSPGGDDASVGGFLRRDDEVFEPPAPTMFAVQPLISTAERAKDAARLEARGGFNDLAPATPREVPAPRQYINEKGLLTQTRPAANFDSPSDTPLRSHRQTYSTLDSQSQAMEETQLASAQTPTQITQRATASQRPNALRRTEALSNLESVAEVAPTEMAATEVVATTDGPETQIEETQPEADTQDESQDIRPSAAQVPAPGAPANAFAFMQAAAARKPELEVARPAKGRGGNAFIDTEANLSDEEGDRVFGGVSDDENEDDHDQELAELVDNTKEDEEVEAEQDEEAARLHREKEAEAEQAALARAQRVVDGKERNKRGRNELSDDDFDDDYARSNRREKQARVVVETVADLKANDDTRGFGDVLEKGCVPETNDTSWLNQTQEESADEDDEMDAAPSDVFGSKSERINPYDVRAQVINLQRERNDAGESAEDPESMLEEHFSLPGLFTSSPSRDIEINDRLISTGVGKKKRVDHIDSQSLYSSTTAEVQYSAVGGDESQSMSAAVTSSRSAITSFKRTEKSKSQAAIGGTSNKAKAKGTPLSAKPSRLGNWRKRDAA